MTSSSLVDASTGSRERLDRSGPSPFRATLPSDHRAVGLVRPGCRLARSRRHSPSQASLRRRPGPQTQPSLSMADPGRQPWHLHRAGGDRLRCRADLASSRPLALDSRRSPPSRFSPRSWRRCPRSMPRPYCCSRPESPSGSSRSLNATACDFNGFLLVGFPAPLTIVAILAGSVWYRDHSKRVAENARPAADRPARRTFSCSCSTPSPPATPALTVTTEPRPTLSTNSASRGIRFDCARSTSSWTLPSHASMFTGRWPHELRLGWLTPLDDRKPTIAEFLGDHGYATAGFVANTWFCGSELRVVPRLYTLRGLHVRKSHDPQDLRHRSVARLGLRGRGLLHQGPSPGRRLF